MNTPDALGANDYSKVTHHHGISWGAIIGGAFAAMAVSLILLMLGSALGLSSVSPWSYSNITLTGITAKMAIWLVVMQWISSGLGGYLAGRLRCKWHGLHNNEVFFRDTAHGFLAWSVATVVMAGLLTSAAASAISGGVHAAATVSAGAAANNAHSNGDMNDPLGYYVDSLYRTTNPSSTASNRDITLETTRILATGTKNGTVPDADKAYLAQLVSAHTGLNQTNAAKRVDDIIAQINSAKEKAKEEAEAARKAGMKFSVYLFLSMLIGAFIASAAAAHGGKQRDIY